MLAQGSSENSEIRSSIEAFFEKEQIIGGITREEARRKVDRYHLKVKSRQKNVSTWGGTIDAAIYSLLTGKRVLIISNKKEGTREKSTYLFNSSYFLYGDSGLFKFMTLKLYNF